MSIAKHTSKNGIEHFIFDINSRAGLWAVEVQEPPESEALAFRSPPGDPGPSHPGPLRFHLGLRTDQTRQWKTHPRSWTKSDNCDVVSSIIPNGFFLFIYLYIFFFYTLLYVNLHFNTSQKQSKLLLIFRLMDKHNSSSHFIMVWNKSENYLFKTEKNMCW